MSQGTATTAAEPEWTPERIAGFRRVLAETHDRSRMVSTASLLSLLDALEEARLRLEVCTSAFEAEVQRDPWAERRHHG